MSNRAITTANRSPDEAQLRFTIATLSHFETDLKVLLGADENKWVKIDNFQKTEKKHHVSWKTLSNLMIKNIERILLFSPIQTIQLIEEPPNYTNIRCI